LEAVQGRIEVGKLHTDFRLLPKSVTLNGIMTTDLRYLCGSWAYSKWSRLDRRIIKNKFRIIKKCPIIT